FLELIERAGELMRVPGAHWNLEMGTLAESVNERRDAPAVLFEDVPEYPRGFRVLSGSTHSMRRLAITLGFPVPGHPLDVVRAYRDRMKTHRPISPRVVGDGPVRENIVRDGEVDVLKFPVPFLHELDGGRYIGTDDIVIMRDPEENWVNCGTYRVMVHDAKRVGVWMSPGKHGRQIREKYFKQGNPCPVLVSCGPDTHYGHTDAPAVGFLLQQVRDEGGDDLGRSRARRRRRCEGRVVPRSGRRAHVQRDRHQAGLRGPCQAGRAGRGELPIGFLSRTVHRRGRRRHRPDESFRSALGDVHALRSCGGHRHHPQDVERPPRSAYSARRDLELARGDRRVPSVRDARGLSPGSACQPGASREGRGEVQGYPLEALDALRYN